MSEEEFEDFKVCSMNAAVFGPLHHCLGIIAFKWHH